MGQRTVRRTWRVQYRRFRNEAGDGAGSDARGRGVDDRGSTRGPMSAVLTDINTVEVSLVTRGANRQRFALRKNEGKESTMATDRKGKITKAMLTEMADGP